MPGQVRDDGGEEMLNQVQHDGLVRCRDRTGMTERGRRSRSESGMTLLRMTGSEMPGQARHDGIGPGMTISASLRINPSSLRA